MAPSLSVTTGGVSLQSSVVSTTTNDPPVPDRPTVFISYSHRDEGWKDRLAANLRALELQDDLEVWDDRRIAAGDGWFAEIEAAMDRAAVAVLLVSTDFLASGFIRGTEVPHLLKRRQEEGLRILPLFVRPSPWQAVDWLAAIQGRPKDAKPLSGWSEYDQDQILADLALEIRSCLTAPTASPLSRSGGGRWERGLGGEVQPRLDLGRLPIAGPLLIGRETELAHLDAAWEDPGIHVLTFVAFGGTGKSALLSHWLDRMSAAGWRGARRVLDWSFYSQGTEERVTSADRFLDHALAWFGDPNPKAGAPRDRGLRLAALVREEKTLLVLDGVEPLQHPPSHPLAGRLKDPGLAALLKGLAGANPGLCVVTTRERIADLDGFTRTAPQEDLEALSPEAGAELLKQLGVTGKDLERLAASREFSNHALTLSLLGGYLSRACGGDIRRRKDVDLTKADQRKGGHALRVIGTYAGWLGEGPELAALRLLGLFDRPAQPKALAALRAKPAIAGLTEPLMDLGEESWQLALTSLREQGLLLPADPHHPGTLDAHPLVRVFFQEDLETHRSEAWKAGNLRLYEHLQKEAPALPDTLETMEPLYTAVIHGCRAGRQQEALYEVYWRRIQRGEHYSWKKLGSFGSDLSALAGFFDHPWDQPSTGITAADQAFVLNQAGLYLRALGRLAEAVQPMEAGLEMRLQQENWLHAARIASNLSELTLTLGEVARAASFGKQSVDLADRSGDAFYRVFTRATLADALHQSGHWEESAEAFREAEALQAEDQPEYPLLYGLPSYQYCDLLLSRGEPESGSVLDGLAMPPEAARRLREAYREVRERAEQTLEWAAQVINVSLLDIAVIHLSLSRAHLGLALMSPEADFAKAAEHLDHAVEGLRRAGTEDHLPRGLLFRCALRRLRGDLAGAEVDLSEALEIAERGSMRLFMCDAHLEWARLCRQRGDRAGQQEHVARARKLVEETGYGRRRREVEWLAANNGQAGAE